MASGFGAPVFICLIIPLDTLPTAKGKSCRKKRPRKIAEEKKWTLKQLVIHGSHRATAPWLIGCFPFPFRLVLAAPLPPKCAAAICLTIRGPGQVLGVCGAVVVGMGVVGWPFVAPALRRHCLPFVPASDAQVRNVVRALQLAAPKAAPRPGARRFVDLGSGDGRIVLAAGKHGLPGVGYELNPWLVLYSRCA